MNFSDPTVTNCKFIRNSATIYGGGMHNSSRTRPIVVNCTFAENTADTGAGMNNFNGSPKVINCTFWGNTAKIHGGGMNNRHLSSPTVTNCIFWENSDAGGTDESAQIHVDSGAPVVTYSDVQGGWTGAGGTGNLATQPLFVNAAGGDLHLQAGSSCIDTGDNGAVTQSTDLDGNLRIVNVMVDMGAYEVQSAPAATVPADRDADGDVDGVDFSTFASCFNKAGRAPKTLGCNPDDQDAFDFDNDGDIDGVDFSVFASCFNKAGNPSRTLGCPQE